MRRSPVVLVALALAIGLAGLAAPARAAAPPVKVTIIVGPVGPELTPIYLQLAQTAASTAEAHGALVSRVYSPYAHAQNVIEGVEGANIVVYFGHGVGSPNPYSASPNPATTNGWGLNGPGRRGDHSDSWQDGTLKYFGEAWIAEHANPAPGWTMIYSNACYAAGAGEQRLGPATPEDAASRVAAYSRAPLLEMGASAYFATDFYEGAAHLIDRILGDPTATYGEIFAAEATFEPAGLSRLPNPTGAAGELWLHRSAYFEGQLDFWYAFAGEPTASPASGMLAGTAVAAVQSVAVAPPARAVPAPPGGIAFDPPRPEAIRADARSADGVVPANAASPY